MKISRLKYGWVMIALLLVYGVRVKAQINRFEVVNGGINYNYGYAALQSFDGKYMVLGATSSMGNGNTDVYLFKLDTAGNVIWQRTYGGTNVDVGRSFQQTKDSGFIISGYTNSFSMGGDYDFYLIKTDSLGNLQWSKAYGGINWDIAYSVKQTPDKGYIMVGGTYSYGQGNEDVYLIKTDSVGDTLWTKTYGGTGIDEGRSVWVDADSGFFITGYTNSFSAGGDTDIYLIRTNSMGDTLWTKSYHDTLNQALYSGQQTTDSSFISVGYTEDNDSAKDIYLVKCDKNGGILWTRRDGGANDDVGYSVVQIPDGNYVYLGYTKSFGQGEKDYVLYRIDKNNFFLNAYTFGGTNDDVGYSVSNTNDNGFLITGITESYGVGIQNIYTIKTDSNLVATGVIKVGISEVEGLNHNDIRIYPNPCDDYCEIKFISKKTDRNIVLYIYNLLGERIYYKTLVSFKGTTKFKILTKGMSSGIYLIEVVGQDYKYVKKLLIQH